MSSIEEIRNYCLSCINKPCSKEGCPLGNDIPTFIHEDNNKKAFEILSKTTVLPAICGRICPHSKQCQGKCIRGIKGEPVQIGQVESYIGDISLKENYKIINEDIKSLIKNDDDIIKEEKINEYNRKIENTKVAVIGSGPCGLTCAAFLAKYGIKVTIYEKYSRLGGLLRHGIPDFRLDREIVEKTIDKILELGIKVETNTELGKDIRLKELTKQYDAVFISIGANLTNKSFEGKNVIKGNDFLEKLNVIQEKYNQSISKIKKNEKMTSEEIRLLDMISDLKNKRVVISGGGNVAMDCARTFIRLGADVTVIYRRDEEQMPAEKYEIEDAKKEGAKFTVKTNILSFDSETHVMECIKTQLVKKENEDRLSPINIEGTNYKFNTDYLVLAIGSHADNKLLQNECIDLDEKGYIKINKQYQTSMEKVYAGGDVVGTNATVAYASKNGREAAECIIKNIIK